VLLELGEVEEAHAYFQEVFTKAQAKERIPISLEAQVGLAYIAAIQARADRSNGAAADSVLTQSAALFRHVYHHPAATQQTRDRISQLTPALAMEEMILSV
jgi:hypothetical protein